MKYGKRETEEAIKELRELLKPGDVVFTDVASVARSGMSRTIRVMVMRDNEPRYITWLTAKACGYSVADVHGRDALKVGGCGMDMGFAVVYDLSRVLFPDGFDCLNQSDDEYKCPGNDHSNYRRGEVPQHHNDGGYALRQRWL